MTTLMLTKVNGLGAFKSPIGVAQASINHPQEFMDLYHQMRAIVERRELAQAQMEMFPARLSSAPMLPGLEVDG